MRKHRVDVVVAAQPDRIQNRVQMDEDRQRVQRAEHCRRGEHGDPTLITRELQVGGEGLEPPTSCV
jgi:hypothetical protein